MAFWSSRPIYAVHHLLGKYDIFPTLSLLPSWCPVSDSHIQVVSFHCFPVYFSICDESTILAVCCFFQSKLPCFVSIHKETVNAFVHVLVDHLKILYFCARRNVFTDFRPERKKNFIISYSLLTALGGYGIFNQYSFSTETFLGPPACMFWSVQYFLCFFLCHPVTRV